MTVSRAVLYCTVNGVCNNTNGLGATDNGEHQRESGRVGGRHRWRSVTVCGDGQRGPVSST
jgi:hypothetical protein